jgi:hypothetical protein
MLPNSTSELPAFLQQLVSTALRDNHTLHQFETALWKQLLQAGHDAVADFLRQQGSGDLGSEVTLPNGGTVRRLDQPHARDLTCLFGRFTLMRTCYGSREGQTIAFVPLDARLDLPRGNVSYALQDLNTMFSACEPFARVSAIVEKLLGLKQSVDSLERQNRRLSERVDDFQESRPAPPAAEEGSVFVLGIDAKGVPMRGVADAPSIKSHEHKRGPKTGRKKQAMVAAVYSVNPLIRTPEHVAELLFCEPRERPELAKRPELCHKRVRARLNEFTDADGVKHDGLAEAFRWMTAQAKQRNAAGDKVVVRLMDGDERFRSEQKRHSVTGQTVDILDLLHVTPRLWKASRLLNEDDATVRRWVESVLKGKVEVVLDEWRGRLEKLGTPRRKQLTTMIGYLEKRRGRMRYNVYLKKGYPIATGVIEGACRHYVKDRMEGTGMSWRPPGAQAMLRLRCVLLNGEWEEYQEHFRSEERKPLYPHYDCLNEVKWPVAA